MTPNELWDTFTHGALDILNLWDNAKFFFCRPHANGPPEADGTGDPQFDTTFQTAKLELAISNSYILFYFTG